MQLPNLSAGEDKVPDTQGANSPTMDITMSEEELTPPEKLSILTDFEAIAEKAFLPREEEVIDQQCFHWEIREFSKLPDRARGPLFEVGGRKCYDSKKTTGHVGMTNQGATCYMNSLFQSLYCTNYFRKAVYQIPTENDEPNNSVAYALQRMFYNLQFTDVPVSTTELTRSFGWTSLDAFMQHDVQEFNRVLQDNLEVKMKGTPADGAIKNLFLGRMKSYIKCINVNYESSRLEDYYDIQLNVKGCKNLEESFKDYVAEETLEGDNKYMAEGYGLQDAKKGVIFESFPPVLHLQLKRFEYDFMRDTMVKINDRHEFPLEIDLEPFLSETADRSQPHKYLLHGVLVHSGDLSGGHYFAFVKPTKDGRWLKFDDDRVVPATTKEVLDENYGDEHTSVRPAMKYKRFTNAYMLLITDKSFQANEGFDIVQFDEKSLANHFINVIRVPKSETYGKFKEKLCEETETAPSHFRLWVMVNRQNHTIRPDAPILDEEENCTLEELRDKYQPSQANLRLYVETPIFFHPDGTPSFPTPPPSYLVTHTLVFVKLFEPDIQKIRGVGKIYVLRVDVVGSIEKTLNEMFGYEPGTELVLYEEIKPQMIEPLDKNATFINAEIQDGDIICAQKKLTEDEKTVLREAGLCDSVQSYMHHLLHEVQVVFLPKDRVLDVELQLVLSDTMKYYDVAAIVAAKLGTEPDKIRFFLPQINDEPKPILRPASQIALGEMLQTAYSRAYGFKLFYEVLNVGWSELKYKRLIKIIVCRPTMSDTETLEIVLPKENQISDLIDAVNHKLHLTDHCRVRIFEAINNRFYREFIESDPISELSDSNDTQLYMEDIPEEELEITNEDSFINVFHYQRDCSRTHSVPFKFLVKKDEAFVDTKKRLQKRTGMDDKEWAKVRFTIVSLLSTTHIKDDGFQLFSHEFSHGDSLGLDHIDKSGRYKGTNERGLFIKG
ncbi:hypothetical protein EC973_007919 [Apophysomyces ossiformis]|uniref:Ubiquitin carboxyl-terminal hydrolase n=1 Tax=Apophysomyces ossiformis TaxID=679940 RepID=A0A8H7EQ65_9FUNG|nr:hypothetical protein EC973_007919 [Apophysomyces ossiformis]